MRAVLLGTEEGMRAFALDGSAAAATVELDGRDVTALAEGPGGLWAILDGKALARRDDADLGRGTWTEVARVRVMQAQCLHAAADTVLVGTSEAHLVALDGDRLAVVDAFESAEGRDTWYTPWGGPPDVRSLAQVDGTRYVNVHVGGILRSAALEGPWVATIDVDADVHEVRVHPDGTVYAAAAGGLAISTDGGEEWMTAHEGLQGRYCRAVAFAGDAVLVSASTGPFSSTGAVYRRALGSGGAFEKCEQGLPEWFAGNVDTGWLDGSGEISAVAGPDGTLYLSEDAGASWRQVAAGLPEPRSVRVTAISR